MENTRGLRFPWVSVHEESFSIPPRELRFAEALHKAIRAQTLNYTACGATVCAGCCGYGAGAAGAAGAALPRSSYQAVFHFLLHCEHTEPAILLQAAGRKRVQRCWTAQFLPAHPALPVTPSRLTTLCFLNSGFPFKCSFL